MSLIDGWRHRIAVLLRGEAYAAEVAREHAFHRELATLAESGEPERTTNHAFGNATYYREEVRRMTLASWTDRLRQDFSYARRGIARSPGFAAAVVITLGLGIGVNGAMFSLIDRVFFQQPERVVRPEEIRRIYQDLQQDKSAERFALPTIGYPQFRAFRAALDSSIALAAFTTPDSIAVVIDNARIPARRSLANDDYFRILGIRPAAGRFFGIEEADIAVQTPVAVISDAFWRRAFGANRAVIGARVRIAARDVIIVGVAPRGFTGVDLDAVDVWMPLNMYEGGGGGGGPWYQTFGARIHTMVRAANPALERRVLDVGTVAVRPIEMRGLSYDPTVQLVAGPISLALGPASRPTEVIVATRVAGVALMVLILACANVTNLFLLRAAQRRREIAVRQALGVSRMRLVQQMTAETVLLALMGGATAVVFAVWCGSAIRRVVLPRVQWASSAVDLRTIAFIGVVAMTIGVIAGFAAALRAMRPDVAGALKAGSRTATRHGSRLRAALVTLQAAVCLVLLVGAGLFIRSLNTVQSIGVGYEPRDRVLIRPAFDDAVAHGPELRRALPEAARRLRTMPGIIAVGYTSIPPLQGAMFRSIYLPGMEEHVGSPGTELEFAL